MAAQLALAPEEPDASTPLLISKIAEHSHDAETECVSGLASRAFVLLVTASGLILLATTAHSVSDLALARYIYCRQKYPDSGLQPYMLAEEKRCFDKDISQKVAFLMGLLPMAEGIPNTFLVLLYGKFSDTWGRRPIFIAVSLGALVQLLAMIVSATWPSIGVWPMYVGAIFSGLCGSGPALKTAIWCYLCEVLPEKSRMIGISWFTAMSYGTYVVGPILGAWLLRFGLSTPLWFGVIMMSFDLVILCWLPESLQKSESASSEEVSTYVQTFKESFAGVRLLFSRRTAFILGSIALMWTFTTGTMLIFVQHLINYFGWSTTEGASFYSAFALSKVTVYLFVVPAVTRFCQPRVRNFDYKLLKWGILGFGSSYVCYALVRNTLFLPFIILLQALSSPFTVAMRIFIADLAPPSEIGRVFAAISLVEGLGDLSGPFVWNGIYAWLLGKSKEASSLVFLLTASVFFVGHISTYFLPRDLRPSMSEA
ncbi:major facilitator superfamily domain-containing protein [Protomyces lactucae-debilis]|uniref:Major facilitator superfamily domain-containing protein n=1 Tax=Protomyces lactucae-debilis TaxID=2754530 RepID=A0A1Y2EZE3_PROLT|nr:major facilitator superfamily domain-containing protein [Protomyces lactucae-debilis]ORY77001.1 major facilitator superfamily domain-containing protein [Protomyces lactucae-debilis]